MKNYILNRLQEASTWRGVIMLVTAAGVPLNPAYAEHVIALGMAASGLVGVIASDKVKKVE